MTEHAPSSEQEIAACVRASREAGAALEIRGGGTRAGLGRPVQAAATLSTANHRGITLYEPGALTLSVKSGTPVAEIEAALSAENQQLPFEPMDHRLLLGSSGEPTIGGVVACAVSGPRRIQAGACRDYLLGMRFVTGEGAVVKSGGRVMKNVTGYDLAKLLCGSYGTLGVISEMSFKVLPAPEARATLLIEGLDDAAAIKALSAALTSPFDVSGAAHAPVGVDGGPVTMIRLEGLEAQVAYRAARLRDILGESLGGSGRVAVERDMGRTAEGWRWIRDVEAFAGRPGVVWRCSLRPGDGPALPARLREVGAPLTGWLYDWGGGLVWLLIEDEAEGAAATVRAEVAALGGHAAMIRAPAPLRAAMPPFQPRDPRLAALEQGLRARFDPDTVLNPGRMAA